MSTNAIKKNRQELLKDVKNLRNQIEKDKKIFLESTSSRLNKKNGLENLIKQTFLDLVK